MKTNTLIAFIVAIVGAIAGYFLFTKRKQDTTDLSGKPSGGYSTVFGRNGGSTWQQRVASVPAVSAVNNAATRAGQALQGAGSTIINLGNQGANQLSTILSAVTNAGVMDFAKPVFAGLGKEVGSWFGGGNQSASQADFDYETTMLSGGVTPADYKSGSYNPFTGEDW